MIVNAADLNVDIVESVQIEVVDKMWNWRTARRGMHVDLENSKERNANADAGLLLCGVSMHGAKRNASSSCAKMVRIH